MTTHKPPARILFRQSTSGIQVLAKLPTITNYSHIGFLKSGREFRDIKQAQGYARRYIQNRKEYDWTIDQLGG